VAGRLTLRRARQRDQVERLLCAHGSFANRKLRIHEALEWKPDLRAGFPDRRFVETTPPNSSTVCMNSGPLLDHRIDLGPELAVGKAARIDSSAVAQIRTRSSHQCRAMTFDARICRQTTERDQQRAQRTNGRAEARFSSSG
jgi:hypothetical protein